MDSEFNDAAFKCDQNPGIKQACNFKTSFSPPPPTPSPYLPASLDLTLDRGLILNDKTI